MKILYIADYLHGLGGGELNDKELVGLLLEKGHDVILKECHKINKDFLIQPDIKTRNLIISNFKHLKEEQIGYLIKNFTYIIYEHDHKYLENRNPAEFKNYLAPKEKIINLEFYKNAKAIICQSTFHKEIVKKNLELNNIHSVGGNLWSLEMLDVLRQYSKREKKDRCSVVNFIVAHKNTEEAIRYCMHKKMDYELINRAPPLKFLKGMGVNKKLVFFPKTPETLCRLIVEARMMGMTVITNGCVGATKEEWFKLKGGPLIDLMKEKRHDISNKIVDLLNGK